MEGAALSALQQSVLDLVLKGGHRHFDEPVQLASGEWSHDFIDAKRALKGGDDLRTACEAMLEQVEDAGVVFDAVGGLTLGADQFAHGIALVASREWFVIRKAAKGRGTNKRIEGALLGPGVRCVVTDDVATTGGSILEACDVVLATGASVELGLALVDRGETTKKRFAERGIPFRAVVTYEDLGIAPVGRA